MKIQTMSVVVGTNACNATCPFCVSKQTPKHKLSTKVNWRNFNVALSLADRADATTILFTGKGEPTLYPSLISSYLSIIRDSGFKFPFIELQTNGMQIGNGELKGDLNEETVDYSFDYLADWYKLGLTTVALSAVSVHQTANKKIYGDKYPDIKTTAKILIDKGFTVRLSIMMLNGFVSNCGDIDDVVNFCIENKIKQLTLRPIVRVEDNSKVAQWVDLHTLPELKKRAIIHHVESVGKPILHLAHGATVYDFRGQNLCLSNCLTTNDTSENMRQIIFYPDGTIGYDWKYTGAVLL